MASSAGGLDREVAAPPGLAAAFGSGASTAAGLGEAVQAACAQALQQLGGQDPHFALLFTWNYRGGDAAAVAAAQLPASCHVVGCEASAGVVGSQGLAGDWIDVCPMATGKAQQGVAILLGRLPGRHVAAFSADGEAPGPGHRHRAGQRISAEGKPTVEKLPLPVLPGCCCMSLRLVHSRCGPSPPASPACCASACRR